MSTTRASDEGCPASILDGTFSSGRIMPPPGPHRDSYSKGKLAIPDGYLALGLYLCCPKFVSRLETVLVITLVSFQISWPIVLPTES